MINELTKKNIEVLNFGENLNAFVGSRNPCDLGNESCYGHLTAEGNKSNADALFKKIKELGPATPIN